MEPTVVNKIGCWHVPPAVSPEATMSHSDIFPSEEDIVDLLLDLTRRLVDNCAVPQSLWYAKRVLEVLGLVSGNCFWNACPSTTGRSGAVDPSLVRVHPCFNTRTSCEAMYDVGHGNLGVESSSHTNFNHLLVRIISALTSSVRLDVTFNFDVTEFRTNVVPRPRVMSNCSWPRSSCLPTSLGWR